MDEDQNHLLKQKIKRKLLGGPRDIHDPSVFHKIALIPHYRILFFPCEVMENRAE